MTKELNEKISILNHENFLLKDKNKDLSNFIFEIVHDLKNPLLVISGYLKLILEKNGLADSNPDSIYLNKMNNEISTLNEMLKKYLDFIIMYNSLDELKITNLELNTIVDYYYNHYLDIAKDKKITIKIYYSSLIPQVIGNEEKISYILSNIFITIINSLIEKSLIEIKVIKLEEFVDLIILYNNNFIKENAEKNISIYKLLSKIIVDVMTKIGGSFHISNDNENNTSINFKFKISK